uniref:Copper transport protein n=1 Tax=Moschus moschiferus TaxID=68415 RepID=A0A8C6FYM3_MOSMO
MRSCFSLISGASTVLQPFTILNFWAYNLCWQPVDGNCCDRNIPAKTLGTDCGGHCDIVEGTERQRDVLFPSMALSVLVILLLAVLYESIKVGKARLLHRALMNLSIPTSQQLIEEADQDSSSSDTLPVSRSPLRWFLCHFGQSLLHVAQVVVGYFMMLAVMSYNTWIFFGVVLGSGVGYYLAYPLLSMT